MAATKALTQIFNAVTLTAGAGDNTSSAVDLTDGYGGTLNFKITNGGTGPTIPAQVTIEVSEDNTKWYEVSVLVANLGNNVVTSSGMVPISIATQYLRLIAGSNTDQDVVIDADISEVTAI
jgi:hypothetical protein